MEIKTRWAQDKNGKVIPFATVSLFYEGTTDLVTGLEDKDGSPLSNPFQSDVNGKTVFAAPDGQYDIKFSDGPRESTSSIQFLDVSGALQVVENIDTLRSITGNNGRDYILAKFHTSEGDGGGGNFYWESGAAPGTYVDNNGTIIVPTGGDGSAAWAADLPPEKSIDDIDTGEAYVFVQDYTGSTAKKALVRLADIVPPTVVGDAVGEWWITPLATHLDSPYPRLVTGAISSDGTILACEFNYCTQKVLRVPVGQAVVDDHNVPSLHAEPGRRFVMAWTNHNADDIIWMKVSDKSGDLRSFEYAPLIRRETQGYKSYTQITKINHLSTDEYDHFWMLTRRSVISWELHEFQVFQSTGAIEFIRTAMLFRSPTDGPSRQCYVITASATNDQGDQLIRCAWGYNPALDEHQVYGFEINTVTGDIVNVVDESVVANIEGDNLPINDDGSLEPLIPDNSGEGKSRRLFYVRPGPDKFAVAYADWSRSDPDAAEYKMIEVNRDFQLWQGLNPGANGFAITPYRAEFSAQAFTYETFFRLDGPTTSDVELARITSNGQQGLFWLRLRPDRTIVLSLMRPGGRVTGLDGSGTVPLPGAWGDVIGLRLVCDPAGTPKCAVYYSLDSGDTWTLFDSGSSSLYFDGALGGANDPLVVPSTISGTASDRPLIKSAHFSAGGVTIGLDFVTEWPKGESAVTDSAGSEWTLEGDATVNPIDKYGAYSFGVSGPRIGYSGGANYIAGMSFDNPSFSRTVYTAHSEDGYETVLMHRWNGSGYAAPEIIAEQPTSQGRLARPYGPNGNGPIKAICTEITRYVSYTSYEGNIKQTT